jgi:hypothetical protein
MTCLDCTKAAAVPHWAGFMSYCPGCTARSVSRSPLFASARRAEGKAGHPDVEAYLAMIERIGVTHEAVREAWKADATNQPAPQAQTTKE